MPERNTRVGKLPLSLLGKLLSVASRYSTPATILGPSIGEDAGVVELPECMLVAHADPITEASTGSGRLAVIVASNDVAATGARPRWIQIVVLLPPGSHPGIAESLVAEAAEEASKLGIQILGGHTEWSPGLEKPVVVAFAYGCACKTCLTPTSAVRVGDEVAIVGWAGLEGMRILAADFREELRRAGVPESAIREAVEFPGEISIVDVAVRLAESGLVNAMHDATEGGVLGALVEMALASGLSIKVEADRIPVPNPLRVIAEKTGVSPLKLISSGALLVTYPPENRGQIEDIVRRSGRPFSPIGVAVEGPGQVVLNMGGQTIILREPPEDEISRYWR